MSASRNLWPRWVYWYNFPPENVERDLLRFRRPVLQVGCPPPVSKNPPLSSGILEHKGPSTVFLKASVLVKAAPRGWKNEKDAVPSAFEIVRRTKAEFQVSQRYGVVTKSCIPLRRCILAAKSVGREILDDDESIVHEDRWQNVAFDTSHVARKGRDGSHDCRVRAIGAASWLR